jgi:hypothetical protein
VPYLSRRGGQNGGQRTQAGANSARPAQSVCAGKRSGPRFGLPQIMAYPLNLLRDEGATRIRRQDLHIPQSLSRWHVLRLTLAFHRDAGLSGASTVKGAPELGR